MKMKYRDAEIKTTDGDNIVKVYVIKDSKIWLVGIIKGCWSYSERFAGYIAKYPGSKYKKMYEDLLIDAKYAILKNDFDGMMQCHSNFIRKWQVLNTKNNGFSSELVGAR